MKPKTKLIIVLFYLSLVGIFGTGFRTFEMAIQHDIIEVENKSDYEKFLYAMEHSIAPYLLLFFVLCLIITGVWLIVNLVKNKKNRMIDV